jgi:alkylhydroperoxidase family enzyme
VREIAICRVAVLNGAGYEWEHHAPLARKGGVGEEGMKVLGREESTGEGSTEEGLSEKQWAVVRYTDAMTRGVRVTDEVFGELGKHFDDREVVEITATVGLEIFHTHFCG